MSHKPNEENSPFLLHAQFTPHGHSLILVHKNDIYYMSGPKSQQSYRITKSAVPGTVYNGVPDWLYEGLSYFLTKKSFEIQVKMNYRRNFTYKYGVMALKRRTSHVIRRF